jgi:MbtH protein
MSSETTTSIEETWEWKVLANAEEQHSLWPAHRPVPAGWMERGLFETRQEALDYVDAHWTDLRPLSLRRQQGGD